MIAIALDDELTGLAILENFCKRYGTITLAKTFTDPTLALKYIQQFPVDLLFLDIQMPSISGLDFYRQLTREIPVIFTTAFSEYAIDGFDLQATDYLLKPFKYERFEKAVTRAKEVFDFQQQKDPTGSGYLLVRADYSLIKIKTADILFVEGFDDYLRIHIEGQKPVVVRMTMKVIQEKLPKNEFIRVHRSFIVPLNRIATVRNTKTILLGEKEIPIGSSFEEEFLKRFKGKTII